MGDLSMASNTSFFGLPMIDPNKYNASSIMKPVLSPDLSTGMQFNPFTGGGQQALTKPSVDLLSREGMFGESGWAMPAAQIGAGALQGFLGLKQMKLARDMFNQQSAYAATDLANQAKTVNESLESRQARRVRENAASTSVSDFMSKYAVSGKVGG
jgi:hypothetical protein